MNDKPFDDGYFAQRAEGNLAFAPDSFMRSPTLPNKRAVSWAVPFVNRSSINTNPDMRSLSCLCPPPVTLNSFAAFAADSPTSGFDPTNPADVEAMYGTGFVGPTVEQAGFVPQQTSSVAVQPASTTGNSILDSISGVIKGLTPAAVSAIKGSAASAPVTDKAAQKKLMTLYLAGQLPNYTINAAGQVVPKAGATSSSGSSSIGPIAVAAVVGIGLVLMMSNSGGGRRRR